MVNIIKEQSGIIDNLRKDVKDLREYVKTQFHKMGHNCVGMCDNSNNIDSFEECKAPTAENHSRGANSEKPSLYSATDQINSIVEVSERQDAAPHGVRNSVISPLTYTTLDVMTKESAEVSPSGDDNIKQPSYSEIASTEGAWIVKQKRRIRQSSKSIKHSPTLRGSQPHKLAMMYLQHITICDNDTDETTALMVKQHGRQNGVDILSAQVIHNQLSDYSVGCKIRVSEAEKDKLLEQGFWPQHIICRPWSRQKQRQGDANNQTVTQRTDDGSLVRTVYS